MKRIGPEYADCHTCELNARCHGKKFRAVMGMPAAREPNGLMIIGEGPGKTEVARDAPFQGPAGDVLDDFLQAAGLQRDETHITNATLGMPPPRSDQSESKKGLHKRFPNAIYSCLPRLEKEIELAKPRVIVTMGMPALVAATGYTEQKNRHIDNPCEHCDPKTRKIGPAIACAKGDCDWYRLWDNLTEEEANERWRGEGGGLEELDGKCPKCEANLKRLKIRQIKCPRCKGKKKRIESYTVFKNDSYALVGENGIAGALFEAKDLPSRWDQFGVKYVIATLHPAYCLHSSGTEQGFGGQFAAQAVLDHIEKAARLLKRDADYRLSVRLTDRADELRAFVRKPGMYDCDIETNAKSPWDVDEFRCIGIGRADREEVLVVDTRRMLEVRRFEEEGYAVEYDVEVVDQELFDALAEFLTDERKPKTWQNGNYDCVVIHRLMGVRVTPLGADTKVAHHSLRPDEPHKLAHIGSGMTDVFYWKEPKKMKGQHQWENYEQLVVYNARDVRNQSMARERMAGHCALDKGNA